MARLPRLQYIFNPRRDMEEEEELMEVERVIEELDKELEKLSERIAELLLEKIERKMREERACKND